MILSGRTEESPGEAIGGNGVQLKQGTFGDASTLRVPSRTAAEVEWSPTSLEDKLCATEGGARVVTQGLSRRPHGGWLYTVTAWFHFVQIVTTVVLSS